MVRVLLAGGADPYQKLDQFRDETPLSIAGSEGYADIVEILRGGLTTPASTLFPTPTIPVSVTTDAISRQLFEATTPPGYSAVALSASGPVWGVPERYTDDSSHGVVAYMLLGIWKGCDFANAEANRRSIVYVKIERLGTLSGYQSDTVCRASSSKWDSWNGLRITHLRFFDQSGPGKVGEYIYDPATGNYAESTEVSGTRQSMAPTTTRPEQPEGSGVIACRVGMILGPGDSCLFQNGESTWLAQVRRDGRFHGMLCVGPPNTDFNTACADTPLHANGMSATVAEGTWTIHRLP